MKKKRQFTTLKKSAVLQTRFIRFRDAPCYLGMDKDLFNEVVRPYLIQIPIGKQGIAFDRLDLDSWADHYKTCHGRPAATQPRGEEAWDENEHQDFTNVMVSGTSTKRYKASDFAKSCDTDNLEEAEKYLARPLETLRQAAIYGVRPKRTFREAATR